VGLKKLPVTSKEKRLRKIGRDGRIILKRILKNRVSGPELDATDSKMFGSESSSNTIAILVEISPGLC
jgi:hypothetical protein